MAYDILDVGLGSGSDTGVSGGTKINDNTAKLEQLQALTGLLEGLSTLGVVSSVGDGLSVGDTIRLRLQKLQGLIEGISSGSGLEFSLGAANFDLSTVTTSRRFTTFITEGNAVAVQYPLPTEGAWNVETRVSGTITAAAGFPAGSLIDYTAIRRSAVGDAQVFFAVKTGATMSPWIDISGGVPNVLTNNDSTRSHILLGSNASVLPLVNGGFYQSIIVNQTEAADKKWPPYTQTRAENVAWTLHVERVSTSRGRLTARATYSDNGAPSSPHVWTADVVISSNMWLPPLWRYVGTTTPTNPNAGPPRQKSAAKELWLRIGQSNAVGVDHLKKDGDNQPRLEPFGLDAPHPKVLDISKGPSSSPTPRGERNTLHMMTRASDAGINTTSFAQQFGKTRLEMHPEIEEIAIMCRARGATSMGDWAPSGGTNPGNSLAGGAAGGTLNLAVVDMVDFCRNKPEYTPMGIIWHQGESDVGQSLGDYRTDVGAMVSYIRSLTPFGDDMIFLAGTMSKSWRDQELTGGSLADKAAIHAAHLATTSDIPNSGVANFDDLIVAPNSEEFMLSKFGAINEPNKQLIHFGRGDLREMGRRYAMLAEGLVSVRQNLNRPRYRMQYDAGKKRFVNALGGTTGQIFEQRFVDDATRGMVLSTETVPASGVYQGFYSDMVFSPSRYTKAAWVKVTGVSLNSQAILTNGNNAAKQAVLMNVGNIANGDASVLGTGFATEIAAAAGAWIHLAVTFDGTDFRRYADGVALTPVNQPIVVDPPFDYNTFAFIQVGQWERSALQQFQGLIDDVYVSSQALNATEIAALAAE